MYIIFGNSNVELCREVGKIDTPKLSRLKSALRNKHFCLWTYISQRIFYRSEKPGCQKLSLCIPFPNQKVFLGYCFMFCKNVAFLLGHPIVAQYHTPSYYYKTFENKVEWKN